jgi:hypothetical protein
LIAGTGGLIAGTGGLIGGKGGLIAGIGGLIEGAGTTLMTGALGITGAPGIAGIPGIAPIFGISGILGIEGRAAKTGPLLGADGNVDPAAGAIFMSPPAFGVSTLAVSTALASPPAFGVSTLAISAALASPPPELFELDGAGTGAETLSPAALLSLFEIFCESVFLTSFAFVIATFAFGVTNSAGLSAGIAPLTSA